MKEDNWHKRHLVTVVSIAFAGGIIFNKTNTYIVIISACWFLTVGLFWKQYYEHLTILSTHLEEFHNEIYLKNSKITGSRFLFGKRLVSLNKNYTERLLNLNDPFVEKEIQEITKCSNYFMCSAFSMIAVMLVTALLSFIIPSFF